jgi:hypothetical protein
VTFFASISAGIGTLPKSLISGEVASPFWRYYLSLKALCLDGMLHCGINIDDMKREFDDSLMKVP